MWQPGCVWVTVGNFTLRLKLLLELVGGGWGGSWVAPSKPFSPHVGTWHKTGDTLQTAALAGKGIL